ncbi:MAG: hypothetical protein CMN77_09570, partial [Spirochaetaceae bacterium]|nr:hypothetical protein [Spirochaetaceae bacterium]
RFRFLWTVARANAANFINYHSSYLWELYRPFMGFSKRFFFLTSLFSTIDFQFSPSNTGFFSVLASDYVYRDAISTEPWRPTRPAES